jgi:hypothetical protein
MDIAVFWDVTACTLTYTLEERAASISHEYGGRTFPSHVGNYLLD